MPVPSSAFFAVILAALVGLDHLQLVQSVPATEVDKAQPVVAVHDGTVTKINSRIAPLTGINSNKLRVTLAVDRFLPNTFAAIGFNDKRQMPGAFIVTCEKQANGTIVIRQRYAFEHAPPPVTPWGVEPRRSSGNTCEFDVPQMLKAPDTVDPDGMRAVIDLAANAPVDSMRFVLNSRGKSNDVGDIQYHGPTKEGSKLQFRKQ